jgi:predicted Zn-dependent protease with MMP-like domain
MRGNSPTVKRILLAALAALVIGLGAVSLIAGFSQSFLVRVLQGLAVFGAGAVIIGGIAVLVMIRLAGWRDPVSEAEFDAIVERAERMAAAESWGESADYETDDDDDERFDPYDEDRVEAFVDERFDPYDEDEFKALVRSAIDDLPLEFHRALEHVAVVVSDSGRRQHLYGLYQGGTVARDYFHDRIVIFRDTLLRDFGHDPEQLKLQVTRTVRHELAHHLGWDEKGVRGLGL